MNEWCFEIDIIFYEESLPLGLDSRGIFSNLDTVRDLHFYKSTDLEIISD